jgi:hypothetical protein
MPAITVEDLSGLRHIPAPGSQRVERPVTQVTTAQSDFEGEGFPVRRAFACVSLQDPDPFVHIVCTRGPIAKLDVSGLRPGARTCETEPCGGGEGTRTLGLRLAKPLLFQLSYTPADRWRRQGLGARLPGPTILGSRASTLVQARERGSERRALQGTVTTPRFCRADDGSL